MTAPSPPGVARLGAGTPRRVSRKCYVPDVTESITPTGAVRRTLRTSTDPRVARTRAAISAAVHQLSGADADITVTAIVRTAGISRASFYSHFASLDELARALTRDAVESIEDLWSHDAGAPAEAMWRAQRRLVDHYAANRRLYAAVAALPVSKEAHLADVRGTAAVIERAIAEHPGRPPQLDAGAVARFVASAVHGLIDAWLTGEVVIDDDAVVEHLVRLLPPWLSGVR